MEEVVLILFVLGLMVLFFLLGAAIGGVARSFKAHFWGIKDNETFCGQAKDTAKDVGFDAAAAALAGGVVSAGVAGQMVDKPVQVTSDDLAVNPAEDWVDKSEEQGHRIDVETDVSRASDEVNDDVTSEDLSVAVPLADVELPSSQEVTDAQVFRAEEHEGVVAVVAGEAQIEDEILDIKEDLSDEAGTGDQDEQSIVEVDEPTSEDVVLEEISDDELSDDSVAEVDKITDETVSELNEQSLDDGGLDLGGVAAVASVVAAGVTAGVASLNDGADDGEGTDVDETVITEETSSVPTAQEPVVKAKGSEQIDPLVWGYTQEKDDYSDITFVAEGDDDDLLLIQGIDEQMRDQLHDIGLRQYDQIAALTERQVGFLRNKFGFSSVLNEQGWIEQAKILASGQLTSYALSLAAKPEEDVSEDALAKVSGGSAELVIPVAADSEDGTDDDGSVKTEDTSLVEGTSVVEELSETVDTEGSTDEEHSLAGLVAAGVTASVVAGVVDAASSKEEQDDSGEREPRGDREPRADREPRGDSEPRGDREPRADREPRGEREPRGDREPRADREPRGDRESDEGSSSLSSRESRRLFGKKERDERDDEWRNRYQGERKVRSRKQRDDSTEETLEETVSVEETVSGAVLGAVSSELVSEVSETEVVEVETEQTVKSVTHEDVLVEPGLSDPTDSQADVSEVVGAAVLSGAVAGSIQGRPVDSDDLHQIKFISTGMEKKLNLLGVYKLSQIANWSVEDIAEISDQLELRSDKIVQEDWMGLAQEALDAQLASSSSESSDGVFSASALIARLGELDKITDLSEHEKTLLSKNGISELSQIANWSGADIKWAADLLELASVERIESWVVSASSLISSGLNAVPGGVAVGMADDLKRIRGVDDEAAGTLAEMGVTTYAQIAEWQQADFDRVNDLLGTSGRVERQYWVVQAKVLKDGGNTDFSKLYDES